MKKNKKLLYDKIFDNTYKTIINRCPELLIPLVNEQFGEHYDLNEKVTNVNKDIQRANGEIEADSVFMIGSHFYHVECQSNPDGTIAVRMLEYDFFIAYQNMKKDSHGSYVLRFPKSCVLYLRHNKNTKDHMSVKVKIDDEQQFEYKVPIVKVQNYTIEELMEKKLYMLLPYYIMRYEDKKSEIVQSEELQQQLFSEYEEIIRRLNETAASEDDDGKRKIVLIENAMEKVIKRIFFDEDDQEVGKRLGGIVMGGEVYRTILDDLDDAIDELFKTRKELQEINAELQEKNVELQEKNVELQGKNVELQENQEELQEKDVELKQKDFQLRVSRIYIAHLKGMSVESISLLEDATEEEIREIIRNFDKED